MPIKLFLEFRRRFFIGFPVCGTRTTSILHLFDGCNKHHLFSLEIVNFLFKPINVWSQLLILLHDHYLNRLPFLIKTWFYTHLKLLYLFSHFLRVQYFLFPFFTIAQRFVGNIAKDIFELTDPFTYFRLFLCHQVQALYHCFYQTL